MRFIKSLALLLVVGLLFTSCEEDSETALFTAEESVTALDTEEFESEVEALVDISVEGFENGRVAGTDSSVVCDRTAITHDRANKTIVIDFGTAGCEGPGGRIRTGKVTIVYTGEFARDHAGEKTMTFENFAVNGNGVTGTVHISAWAKNESDNWQSTVTSTNVVFSFTDGTSFTVTSGTRTREVIQGERVAPIAFRITGLSNGINRAGRTYTTAIANNEPITFRMPCLRSGNPYPVAGRRGVQVEGRPQFKIDFGNGSCDRLAIVQIGDNEPIPIVLGR